MKFSLPVTFNRASRRVDKSVGLAFQTVYEMKPEELMELDRLIQHEGVLTFRDDASSFMPDLVITEGRPATKSKAAKIRWLVEQLGHNYEIWADEVIEKLEKKLEERDGKN